MKKLTFHDTPKFYLELLRAILSREDIEIFTEFTNYSELPKKLILIFELAEYRNKQWVNPQTGAFAMGARSRVGLNRQYLFIAAATVTGAAAGTYLSGPIGAVGGASLGALIGIGTVAVVNGKHEVVVEVDTQRRLRIVIRPK